MGYIKCPRCNLNYIDESESLCRVCLMETGKIASKKEDEFDDDMEICPECGENLMRANETMCSACAAQMEQHKASNKDDIDHYDDMTDDGGSVEDDEMFVSIEEMAYNENETDDEDQDGLE